MARITPWTVIALTSFIFVGCQRSITTTGADTPVSASRLQGSTLASIRNKDLQWTFMDSTLEFTNNEAAIPVEFAIDIAGEKSSPKKISAAWELTDDNTKLRLFNVTIDDEASDKEVSLPISPAGHIRMNLGGQQYNLHKPTAG